MTVASSTLALSLGLATIGVLGTLAGAFVGLISAHRLERKRQAFQRGETDLAELRSILDALAEHVFAIREGVDDLIRTAEWRRAEHQAELHDFWQKRQEESAHRLATAADQAARQIQRLALRLGSEVERAALLVRHNGQAVQLRLAGVISPEAAALEAAERDRSALGPLVDQFVTEARKFTAARLHEEPAPTAPSPKP